MQIKEEFNEIVSRFLKEYEDQRNKIREELAQLEQKKETFFSKLSFSEEIHDEEGIQQYKQEIEYCIHEEENLKTKLAFHDYEEKMNLLQQLLHRYARKRIETVSLDELESHRKEVTEVENKELEFMQGQLSHLQEVLKSTPTTMKVNSPDTLQLLIIQFEEIQESYIKAKKNGELFSPDELTRASAICENIRRMQKDQSEEQKAVDSRCRDTVNQIKEEIVDLETKIRVKQTAMENINNLSLEAYRLRLISLEPLTDLEKRYLENVRFLSDMSQATLKVGKEEELDRYHELMEKYHFSSSVLRQESKIRKPTFFSKLMLCCPATSKLLQQKTLDESIYVQFGEEDALIHALNQDNEFLTKEKERLSDFDYSTVHTIDWAKKNGLWYISMDYDEFMEKNFPVFEKYGYEELAKKISVILSDNRLILSKSSNVESSPSAFDRIKDYVFSVIQNWFEPVFLQELENIINKNGYFYSIEAYPIDDEVSVRRILTRVVSEIVLSKDAVDDLLISLNNVKKTKSVDSEKVNAIKEEIAALLKMNLTDVEKNLEEDSFYSPEEALSLDKIKSTQERKEENAMVSDLISRVENFAVEKSTSSLSQDKNSVGDSFENKETKIDGEIQVDKEKGSDASLLESTFFGQSGEEKDAILKKNTQEDENFHLEKLNRDSKEQSTEIKR